MISSVDGRIDCAMVDKISGDEYYAALKQLDCPSTLTGRVTMEHYSAEKEPFRPSHPETAGKASFHKAIEAEAYTVAIDTRGKLRWPSAEIDGLPLLCITSENATLEYLDRLREQGVSYICVGNGCIDLPKAMEMLHEHFGIERLAVVGGGHINPNRSLDTPGLFSVRKMRLSGILPASVRILFLATPSARREACCMTQAGNLPKV